MDGLFTAIIGVLTSATVTYTDAIIFEGYLRTTDLKNPRKCTVDSPAFFDLKTKLTSGSYAGRTDQIIVSILAVDGYYIVSGTMSNGTAMGTIVIKGNKALQTLLNTFGQIDSFTWVILPNQGQGLLNYNNGTVDSGANITEASKIKNVDGKKQRAIINQVTVKGAINTTTGVPFSGTYNDTASQRLYGVQPISRTFANLNSDALCLAQATAICSTQQLTPYTYTFQKAIGSEGLVLPSETITFAYSPQSIVSGQRIINSLEFYFRAGICKWEVQDAISYTSEMDLLRQEVEENSDLIEQVAERVETKLSDLVNDTTPQLGGDLDLNGKGFDFPTTPNITDCLDEDNMASNSATKICTQQSIKAYADTKCKVAIGVYTGDGAGNAANWTTKQSISLGVRPKAVLIFRSTATHGQDCEAYWIVDNVSFSDSALRLVGGTVQIRNFRARITADGFDVNDEGADVEPNKNTWSFRYVYWY